MAFFLFPVLSAIGLLFAFQVAADVPKNYCNITGKVFGKTYTCNYEAASYNPKTGSVALLNISNPSGGWPFQRYFPPWPWTVYAEASPLLAPLDRLP